MRKQFFKTGLFLPAIFVALLFMQGAPMANERGNNAEIFVQQLADDAVASLTDQDIPRKQRIDLFRDLFKAKFAYRSIGKFVLGRNWRKASKEEQNEYLGLFEDLMVISYVDRFVKYTGAGLKVESSRIDNENTVSVFSSITREGAPKPVHIAWRVVSRNDITKIVDVVIEGASMSSTLRSDFSSMIRQKGGKVSGLIEELRIKTAALKQETAN